MPTICSAPHGVYRGMWLDIIPAVAVQVHAKLLQGFIRVVSKVADIQTTLITGVECRHKDAIKPVNKT